MSKLNKKNPYQLKFDTSKNNLDCFIKKKPLTPNDNDKNDRKTKTSKAKTRSKSIIKKPQELQAQKLISSIVKNAMGGQFEDVQQVSELLNKMQLYGEEREESPTHDDELLKIFNPKSDKCPQGIRSNSLYMKGLNIPLLSSQKRPPFQNKQMQIALGKQQHWRNFSTQMGTDIDTDRSKREGITQQYSSLVTNKVQLLVGSQVNYEPYLMDYFQQHSHCTFPAMSKENPHRKSTPIRGQNEGFRIIIDNIDNDERTTLMIRHIPNKYTQQMLIDQIDLNHKNKYNFFYLPLDSYNPCNVGYAFINFIDTKFIKKFYLEFNGTRWAKFNSGKICELAYGRIQGSTALINHFENSNVMNARDKRIRPFVSFGDNHGSNR